MRRLSLPLLRRHVNGAVLGDAHQEVAALHTHSRHELEDVGPTVTNMHPVDPHRWTADLLHRLLPDRRFALTVLALLCGVVRSRRGTQQQGLLRQAKQLAR